MMTETNAVELKYRGVKGWLLLFVLLLTVFNPIATGSVLLAKFLGFNAVLYFGFADLFWIVVITLFGVYAGIMLWAVKPRAVKKAKAYLLMYGAYAVYLAVYNFYILKPSDPSAAQIGATAGAFIRILVYVGLWWAYFKRSKRVKATYGEALTENLD
jgi:hypothetical protein